MPADDTLTARLSDAVRAAVAGEEKYIGFLTEPEAAVALAMGKNAGVRVCLYGGYADAERVYAAFLPDWSDESQLSFPFSALTFSYRECDKLMHRDFLGSILALGLERDTIGDILIEDGRAVMFISSSVLPYVISQCEKVGRVGVKLTEGYVEPLPAATTFEDMSFTVPSLRLDAVVAGLCKTSRGNAATLIEAKSVLVNGAVVDKVSAAVYAGDKISARGQGKFLLCDISNTTKKGRTVVQAKKYR